MPLRSDGMVITGKHRKNSVRKVRIVLLHLQVKSNFHFRIGFYLRLYFFIA